MNQVTFHCLRKKEEESKISPFFFSFFASTGLFTLGVKQRKCYHNFFPATLPAQTLVHRCHTKRKRKKKSRLHNAASYRVHLYKNTRPTYDIRNTFLLRVRNPCLKESEVNTILKDWTGFSLQPATCSKRKRRTIKIKRK